MQSSEPEAFASRFAESLKGHPSFMELKGRDYRKEVLSRIQLLIAENGISSEKELLSLDLKSTLTLLNREIERKKMDLAPLEDQKIMNNHAWRLRQEIYNDLKPKFDALKILHTWIYEH